MTTPRKRTEPEEPQMAPDEMAEMQQLLAEIFEIQSE